MSHSPPFQGGEWAAFNMLVDSHAHIDDARFNDDRDAVLQRAWDAGDTFEIRKALGLEPPSERD